MSLILICLQFKDLVTNEHETCFNLGPAKYIRYKYIIHIL